MPTPIQRPRRLRKKGIRELVRETRVEGRQLIQPLFVKEGLSQSQPVASMPGVSQYSLKDLAQESKSLWEAGVRSVILFGIPTQKDSAAKGAYAADGVVQKAIDSVKSAVPEMTVISDVCLCEYTDHGHCGIVDPKGNVSNDASVELLAKVALSHAKAGSDMVAPSDMMDGRVRAIRALLDQEGFEDLPIMSYAVKYASAFYGPFRDAAESAPRFGDRKAYQMDPANAVREALREAKLDEEEGADILIVKPAMAYLDVIAAVKAQTKVPVAAYQVSGEYSMLCAAFEKGWLKREEAVIESLTAIQRAGAQIIITYFAKEIAKSL